MNKTLISLWTSLLVFSNSSLAQTDTRTDALVATIEANIASTLIDPCAWEQGVKYLNCRLHEPTNDRYANDAKIYAQIASMRNRWNLWLSQSPYLPFEMRQDRVWGVNIGNGNTSIPQTHIAPTFLPKDLGLKWGVSWSIELKYQTPFDVAKIFPLKQPQISAPPDIIDNKIVRMAWND